MAILCLLNEDGTMAGEWKIGDTPLTIGRGAAADLQIDDDGLSRRHFIIYREGQNYWIRDLSSRNGTWVDGNRAQATLLQDNARILAGRTQFRFGEQSMVETSEKPAVRGPHDTVIIPSSLLLRRDGL